MNVQMRRFENRENETKLNERQSVFTTSAWRISLSTLTILNVANIFKCFISELQSTVYG